jgi:hypothetical protein
MKPIRLTPTLLALALLCFGLPWIEIKCNSGTISQSGLQLARGNWTFTSYSWHDDEPPRTSDPDWEKSEASAVVHGASLIVGLCVALFVYALPWRHILLASSTSTALVCLGLLTRRVYADSTDEIKWEFTVWFFAAWALNVAALGSVVWEIVVCGRRRSGPVGDGELPGV